MIVHCCDRCFVYKKEIQPCSPKYRGLWAICMHKMMFPSESCNSVLRIPSVFRYRGKSLALSYPSSQAETIYPFLKSSFNFETINGCGQISPMLDTLFSLCCSSPELM